MRQRGFLHNFFVGLLVLLASLSFVVTAVGFWTHQTALVPDRFVAVVSAATDSPQVAESLSQRAAEQIVERIDLEQRVRNLLPPNLGLVAVPVTNAVQERLATAINKLLVSPDFQDHLNAALLRLHTGLLNVINGDSQYFTTTDGKLTLDLLAVIDSVVSQLQTDGILPTAADFPRFSEAADRTDFLNKLGTFMQTQLPPDFGQVPIADATQVDAIAGYLHLFDQALVAMAVLTVVLVLAAVVLADRRWNAIAWLAFTTVLIVGLLIVALGGVQSYADGVVANPDNRVFLGALVRSLAESLAESLMVLGVVGLIIAIPAAYMAHRGRKAAEKKLVAAAAEPTA